MRTRAAGDANWRFTEMSLLFAYLDAGTGSLLLQALMGGFAGLIVLSKVAWQSLFSRRAIVVNDHEAADESDNDVAELGCC